MSMPSTRLIEWVTEREEPLPWLSYNAEIGRLEFVIDNFLMSKYRMCPASFMLSAVEGYHLRSGTTGAPERYWALDFGILFHKMMEEYYKTFRSPNFDLAAFSIKQAVEKWQDMQMDIHLSHKECQQMGGAPGFAGMLLHYATQFRAENERLRVLASEVAFGRAKEVPLFKYNASETYYGADPWCEADVYLSGRIDIIADDGFRILPLDHKTMGSFKGEPLDRFLVDDGPTGYIYAMKKVLPTIVPEDLILKRDCNQILMNLISKSIPKEGSRFRRYALLRSDSALESYRQRMISTCSHILADLESYIRDLGVPRNTSACNNWYFRRCEYFDVHRQQDRAGEAATLSNGFVKLKLWNTETVNSTED